MADINTNDFIVTDNNIRLSDRPTHVGLFDDKDDAEDEIKDNAKEIADLAHKLYAEAGRSVIIVLQGMDTSGKDGTTEALFHRTPPLNVNVANFKAPTKKELAHDYLWRVHKVCPAVGQITVFNRSHYEDVLVVKVKNYVSADKIEQRYDQINDFERLLVENDTTVLKFMLHISHETQGERLRERLVETHKLWKIQSGVIWKTERFWPEFMDAYQTMLRRTSTHHAPWYVIPSDSRKTRGAIVSSIVRQSLERMNPQYPDPGFNPEDFEI